MWFSVSVSSKERRGGEEERTGCDEDVGRVGGGGEGEGCNQLREGESKHLHAGWDRRLQEYVNMETHEMNCVIITFTARNMSYYRPVLKFYLFN